ncbi:unnamed protein product [Rotaria sordida]|uniref:Uncharacterized protein n=1 Tax=Rotaria sordida TaxID=392033 RepID=A0A819NRQ3_9BILA|nr:unnamed protein product [Rotaria sordida]CAF3891424.1 unnamed protein product [Rotaria sordida]CAF4002207.1 unnamed protein product [Rotaria sordida]
MIPTACLTEQEEKILQVVDLYEKAAMQAIRIGNFQQAIELLEILTNILTKMERYDRINRLVLCRILLKLFNEDSIAV